MTAQHDPDEIARLIAEAREDDARVSGSRWYSDRPILVAPPRPVVAHLVGACVYPADGCWTHGVPSDVDAAAIARMRNNLRAIADQLEAQRAEIERLTTAQPNWSHAEALQQRDAILHSSVDAERRAREATAERDKLRLLLEARDAIIAAGQRTIDSGNEALRTLREQWQGERDKLRAELESARSRITQLEQRAADLFSDADAAMTSAESKQRELEAARREVERLTALSDLRGQTVADLAHELGTVKGVCDLMRPVVEAAERYRDNGPCYAGIILAVDAYRAARDKAGGSRTCASAHEP